MASFYFFVIDGYSMNINEILLRCSHADTDGNILLFTCLFIYFMATPLLWQCYNSHARMYTHARTRTHAHACKHERARAREW